jgi:hypothetical protein
MQISSNLAGVIGRVQRLRDRDIPAALARTLHPGNWTAAAKVAAEQTLLAIAQPAERQFIPDFIKTLSGVTIEGGFWSAAASLARRRFGEGPGSSGRP